MEKKHETIIVSLRDSVGARIEGVTDNHAMAWDKASIARLIELRKGGASWYYCAAQLKRSPFACEKKAKWCDAEMGTHIHHIADVIKNAPKTKRDEYHMVQRVSAMPLVQAKKVQEYHTLVTRGKAKMQIAQDKANGLTKKVLARYTEDAKRTEAKAITTLKGKLAKIPKGKTIPINQLGK
jgi:hypothetical protein